MGSARQTRSGRRDGCRLRDTDRGGRRQDQTSGRAGIAGAASILSRSPASMRVPRVDLAAASVRVSRGRPVDDRPPPWMPRQGAPGHHQRLAHLPTRSVQPPQAQATPPRTAALGPRAVNVRVIREGSGPAPNRPARTALRRGRLPAADRHGRGPRRVAACRSAGRAAARKIDGRLAGEGRGVGGLRPVIGVIRLADFVAIGVQSNSALMAGHPVVPVDLA